MVQVSLFSKLILLVMFSVTLLLPLDGQQGNCPNNAECCDCPSHVRVLSPPERILRGEVGDNITVHCTRTCGPQFVDRWLIQIWKESFFITVSNSDTVTKEFKDVHFIANNTDSSTCSCRSIEYYLHLTNVNLDINGLVINCGVRNRDEEEWYSPYSRQLFIVNSSTNELTFTLAQAQMDLNITNEQLNTCKLRLGEKTCTTEILSTFFTLIVLCMIVLIAYVSVALLLIKHLHTRLIQTHSE